MKRKVKEYKEMKQEKDTDHEGRLKHLRKDIIDVQKQLNLQRNQLTNIYHMEEDGKHP